MAEERTEIESSVCLNNQKVGNLIKYLQRFPADAVVTVWHDYKEFDCQICCNTEHQIDTNNVQLMLGQFVRES